MGVVLVTAMGHAICHIGETLYAGVTPAVKVEFGLRADDATALGLLGYALLGVGAIPVGMWADAWGPKRVLQIYFFAMAACGVAVALVPSALALLVALTALGLAASIYHPAGLAMLSLGVQARGRAMGINGVAGSLGVAIGPALGMVADSLGNWRIAYLILAGLSSAAGLAMWWGTRRTAASRQATTRPVLPPIDPADQPPAPWTRRGWRRQHSLLLLLFLVMMFGGFNYRSLVTVLPVFFGGTAGSTAELTAGFKVFFILIVGGIGQIIGGWLADRFGPARVYPWLVGGLMLASVSLATIGQGWFALPMASILAVTLFGQQPVENSLLAESTSTGRRSLSYGTKFALTFGIGAVGSYVVGILWRADRLPMVFLFIAASALTMAVLLWSIRQLATMSGDSGSSAPA